jgi:FtsP/CotA-like multicopper oxidase with cupredoxin domain
MAVFGMRLAVLALLLGGAGCASEETLDPAGSNTPEEKSPEEPPVRKQASCAVALAEDLDPSPDVVEVALTAAPVGWDAGTGALLGGLSYNGQVPGPYIVATAGQKLRVRLRNELGFETTLHWHGMRVPNSMDGAHTVQTPIPDGGEFVYELELIDPGFYWYHPHVDAHFAIEHGLYGPLLVRDPAEPELSCDMPIVLDDVLLDENGQVAVEQSKLEAHHGRFGGVLLANGRAGRVLEIDPASRALFRLVNAANSRYFDLALEGHVFEVVATDGGYLEAPYTTERLVLAPGERYTVLLRADGQPGAEHRLMNHRYFLHDNGMMEQDPLGKEPAPLLTLRYGTEAFPEDDPALPWGALPDWTPPMAPVAHRWVIEEFMAMQNGKMVMLDTIDGQTYPNIPDLSFAANELTTLEIENTAMVRHPFHIHGQRFQVVAIDGAPAPHRAWKDTIDVPTGSVLTLMSKLDNPGHWMYHCHILEHAHHGMMGHMVVQ